ncbi:MAG: hypothetical protein WCV82_04390 [Candidatus Paceibacterota bacterium]|jgi:hypothetical protein
MKLAIIGTAGRGDDGARLRDQPGYWRTILAISQAVIAVIRPTGLISGGAAYADHAAVRMFLRGEVGSLTLCLPSEWAGHGFKERFDKFDAGRTANHYHSLFSHAAKIDSLSDIQQAIEKGAIVKVNSGGFKARNSDVANEADALLAFTFGLGPVLKDGGTADTWGKFLMRREASGAGELPAYHYCLNEKRLYRV